jgi:hypothetical protein
MKYLLFLSLILSSCSSQISTKPTLNSDVKFIKSWAFPELPSDFVQTAKSEWAVFFSANEYSTLNSASDKIETKSATTEMYKVEKAKDAYIVLTYDKETRTSTTWQTASLDMASKEILDIEDAADIAYSPANGILYWITPSRQMMAYDFVSKKSSAFMEGHSASIFFISANGKFLVVQDTDSNISVIDLSTNQITLEKKSEAGNYYEVAGALDNGTLILVQMHVIEKGSKPRKNQVVKYTKDGEERLVEDMISSAYVFGNKLVTWADETISLYEL